MNSKTTISIEQIFEKQNPQDGVLPPWAKDLALEFGRQLLELATEKAELIEIKSMNCHDHTPYRGECQTCGSYHNYEIVIGHKLDKESITNIIKLVE